MNKHNADMIRLGLFVIVATVLFILGVYYVGNSKNIFGRNITVYANFNDVRGLQAGNNVRFMGINVGSVSSIEIKYDTIIRVGMRISKSVQQNMKKDARVSIGTNGLVGASIINIKPGKNKMAMVENGDVLKSDEGTSASTIMKTLGNTNETVSELSMNLLEISDKINKGEGTLSLLLNDASMAESTRESLKNINRVTENMNQVSLDLQNFISDMTNEEGLVHYLLRDTSLVLQMDHIMTKLDSMLSYQLEPGFDNLSETIDHFHSMSLDMQKISSDLSEGKGTIGLLLNDEETELKVRQIIENLESSSAKLDENLVALRSNWFFRKYFKEKEKKK